MSASIDSFLSIAEGILGPFTSGSNGELFCRCPGETKHSSPGSNRDCRLYLDGQPYLNCFHQSCKAEVQRAGAKLRDAFARAGVLQKPTSTIDTKEHLRRDLKSSLMAIRKPLIEAYAWPLAEVESASPVRISAEPIKHTALFLELFPTDAVVWIGDRHHSGDIRFKSHFRTAEEWKTASPRNFPFISPSIFRSGTFARSRENVVSSPFLVVEADNIEGKTPQTVEEKRRNKEHCAAIFRWLKDEVKLNLRAIVDSGGKSLHGWFDRPPQGELNDLQLVLAGLGCDEAMFRASQPARLPGVLRGDSYQRLLYLAL